MRAQHDTKSVRLFELNRPPNPQTIPGPKELPYGRAIALSPDGRLVASGESQGPSGVWEVSTRKVLFKLDHADAFSLLHERRCAAK